ncbi:MAG: DNA-binding MarR family transcriptional regulator [Myxococcota bacterium]|jgi:DNA-binding MarR family transcriptional regulator
MENGTTDRSATDAQSLDLISSQCLAQRVLLLSRTISAIYNEALRPLGMTAAQLTLLVLIAKKGPVSPGAVAGLLNMEKSTLSRNVTLMSKHGWISVTRETGRPGRSHSLTIEPAGRALIEQALPLWQHAQDRTTALVGEDGARSIFAAAEPVLANVTSA